MRPPSSAVKIAFCADSEHPGENRSTVLKACARLCCFEANANRTAQIVSVLNQVVTAFA
jgi:hypothetical protein